MIDFKKTNGISTLVARGELDRYDCPELDRELDRASGSSVNGSVDLDLTAVRFIDSECARLISDRAESLRGKGRRLRVKASPQVLRTIEMLGKAGVESARGLLFELQVLRMRLA
jgi:anti-anti-sigma factor